MIVRTAWAVDRDAAIIQYDIHGSKLPLDAINTLASMFYNQGLQPFLYEAWDPISDKPVGLVMAESMEVSNDEIYGIFQTIENASSAYPQEGDYGPQEFHL